MSIDQVTVEALALPLKDRAELFLRVYDSLSDEKKLHFDPDRLREMTRLADRPEWGKTAGGNA